MEKLLCALVLVFVVIQLSDGRRDEKPWRPGKQMRRRDDTFDFRGMNEKRRMHAERRAPRERKKDRRGRGRGHIEPLDSDDSFEFTEDGLGGRFEGRMGSRHEERESLAPFSDWTSPGRRRSHGARRNQRRNHRSGPRWEWDWDLDMDFDDFDTSSEESEEDGLFEGLVPPGRFNFGMGPERDPWFEMGLSWGDKEDKSWWTGPNVCVNRKEKLSDSPDEISTYAFFSTFVCTSSETAYECTTSKLTPQGEMSMTETFECCIGFSRKEGDFGCKQEERLVDISSKMDDLGLDSLKSLLNSTGIGKKIFSDNELNFTIFAPTNDALDELFEVVDYNQTEDMGSVVMVSRQISKEMLKDTVNILMGHIVVGRHASPQFSDDYLLDTSSPLKTNIRINTYNRPLNIMTANCQKITRPDNMASNGVVHVLEKPLLPVTDSLMDLVSGNPDLSTLKTILGSSSMASLLREKGHLTLLAPTNDAFVKHKDIIQKLMFESNCADKILKRLILPRVICSAIVQGHTSTPNLLSKHTNLTRDAYGKLYADGAEVISADVMATNGVLHVIDDIHIPDEALGLLKVAKQKGLTAFVSLVEKAGLAKEWNAAEGVTMFVPSNEAINALSRFDADTLPSMLQYHVVPSVQSMSSMYSNLQMETALKGAKLRFNEYSSFPFTAEWVRTVQCAHVQPEQIEGCNGVFYVVDKVLTPPVGNVLDVLSQDSRFSTLIMLMKLADILDTLQTDGPFTIFAPTNEAFDKLGSDAVVELRQNKVLLKDMLLSHVTADFVCCAGITRYNWLHSQQVRTMAKHVYPLGKNRAGKITIDEIKVSECDLTATNGVVHVLDGVLMMEDDMDWEWLWHF